MRHAVRRFFVHLLGRLTGGRSLCWFLPKVEEHDPNRFAHEIADYHRRDAVSPPPEGVVLFIGSSSIRMWHSMARDFPGVPVLNRGFGGAQMSDIVFHAEALLFRYQPSKIVIYGGDNDIAHHKLPQHVMCDVQRLVRDIRRRLPGVPMVFVSAKPSIARWEKRHHKIELNRSLAQLAQQHEDIAFADVWTPMLAPDGTPDPECYLEDQLHLADKAYRIWQRVLAPLVVPPV